MTGLRRGIESCPVWRTMECPVCNVALDFEPWTETGGGSQEICPSCGIQFGYNDARPDLRSAVYEAWRDAWIANGKRPITGELWHRVGREVIEEAKRRESAS